MNLVFAFSLRLVVVFALAIAMATSGFAHRTTAVDLDEGLQSYVSAGGSLADLCGDLDPNRVKGSQTCDACRLVDTAAVPTNMHACQALVVAPIKLASFGAKSSNVIHTPDVAHPVRAPPTA